MTGPCLNPCPEPPPTIQTLSKLGMPVDDELRVRRRLVLADARLDDRRVGQGREAPRARRPGPGGPSPGSTIRSPSVGSNGGP